MEGQLKNEGGSRYWVLFLQPLPETGERVAIALVFHDAGRTRLEFDRSLSRVLSIYPHLDKDSLVFYLDSLHRELDQSTDIALTLNSYGPQILASPPRRMASPISEKVIAMLLAKYVRLPKPRPLAASLRREPQGKTTFSLGSAERSLNGARSAPEQERESGAQFAVEQPQPSLFGRTG